jgi:hypothetical protein
MLEGCVSSPLPRFRLRDLKIPLSNDVHMTEEIYRSSSKFDLDQHSCSGQMSNEGCAQLCLLSRNLHLDRVSTTCGSGCVDDEHAILLWILKSNG